MLIDVHAHSSGISRCCRVPYDEVIAAAKKAGIDGIILCNHYQKGYVSDGDYAAFARRYTEEFRRARIYGDSIGFKVFFGVEITLERHGGAHLLLYGVTEEFIEANPTIFDRTVEEIYAAVKGLDHPVAVVQAHPYRHGKHLLQTSCLDGVEVNCHPLYGRSHFAEMVKIAREHALILTSGGDYHADTYRPTCGVYLPDDLCESVQLGRALLEPASLTLCIHEPNTDAPFDFEWTRPTR